MIIKVFRTGRNQVSQAINYLFSEESHEGHKPTLIKGIPSLTKSITDNLKFKNKYLSGVISFRHGETLTHEHKLDLINSFEKTFAPFDTQERVNFLWVEHFDKGRLELHFLNPRVDLKTQKSFNLHPPGKNNFKLFQTFTQLQNHKFGFEQVKGGKLDKDKLNSIYDEYLTLRQNRINYLKNYYDRPKKQYARKSKQSFTKSGNVKTGSRTSFVFYLSSNQSNKQFRKFFNITKQIRPSQSAYREHNKRTDQSQSSFISNHSKHQENASDFKHIGTENKNRFRNFKSVQTPLTLDSIDINKLILELSLQLNDIDISSYEYTKLLDQIYSLKVLKDAPKPKPK